MFSFFGFWIIDISEMFFSFVLWVMLYVVVKELGIFEFDQIVIIYRLVQSGDFNCCD